MINFNIGTWLVDWLLSSQLRGRFFAEGSAVNVIINTYLSTVRLKMNALPWESIARLQVDFWLETWMISSLFLSFSLSAFLSLSLFLSISPPTSATWIRFGDFGGEEGGGWRTEGQRASGERKENHESIATPKPPLASRCSAETSAGRCEAAGSGGWGVDVADTTIDYPVRSKSIARSAPMCKTKFHTMKKLTRLNWKTCARLKLQFQQKEREREREKKRERV